MSAVTDLLGDDGAIRQILLWSVVGQLIAPVLAPVAQAISSHVWEAATSAGGGVVSVPLSPAEAALGVLRGTIDQGTGLSIAGKSGIDGDDFQRMIDNTGEPISPQEALELLRRGKIDQPTLERAIRQSRVRDEWIPAILDLAYEPMTVADAVAAAVEEQLPYDVARAKAAAAGLDVTDFDTLVQTRGRPPGPSELLELVRRGIIPQDGTGPGVLSLEQGIAESDVKTKWVPAYRALLEYMPPPRTITALERQGVITPTQAQQMYQAAGLTPELAAAYSASATTTKLTKQREITEAQLLEMYSEQFMSAAEVTPQLIGLGYTEAEVTTLLSWEDAKREYSLLKTAIGKIHTLFVNRKIGTTTATNALNALGVASAQQEQMFTTWTIERETRVPTLTAAQIGAGVQYQVIGADQGLQALQDLGYTPWDAWFYLSQHLHQALPNEPAMDTPTGQLP